MSEGVILILTNECAIGLKQGEVISPILFSLFIEDLELFLQGDQNCGLSIDDITFILMLFADDMEIMGKDRNDLQKKFRSVRKVL